MLLLENVRIEVSEFISCNDDKVEAIMISEIKFNFMYVSIFMTKRKKREMKCDAAILSIIIFSRVDYV